MNRDELEKILERHKRRLNNEPGGEIANLMGADLWGADLTGVDLRGVGLWGAVGPFAIGYFGRHHAVAAGGYISIGCEWHTFAHWIENYEAIGRANGYDDAEIARYGAWIKLAVEWLDA